MRALAICTLTLIGCADSGPPTLEVLTPERGSTAGGHEITVTGRVTSSDRVTVNGSEAAIKDGAFSATLTVDDGITLIETHAIGSEDIRDVRAVLAGELRPTDGTISGPIAARVGKDGFAKVGTALAQTAQALDWEALAKSQNPVFESSGCNSAKGDIEKVTIGTIGVGLVPKAGAIDTAVTIDDVFVQMHVSFRAVCISGSTTVKIRSTRAHIDGDLALAAKDGKLSASLPSSAVKLDGFSFDASGVPGAIESLVRDEARKAAEKALNNIIKQQVPPKASKALGGLLAQPIDAAILDRATTFTITPAGVDIDTTGMVAAVDATVFVNGGGDTGMFVSTPMPIDAMSWQSPDLGIAVADDVLNQLFSGLWASGAIAPSLSLDGPAGILGAVLDPSARSIALDMKLPPMVKANGGLLELAIGDTILHVLDESGTEVQSFALSVQTTLAAAPGASGNISVTVGAPTVKAQVLTGEGTTGEQLEGIVQGAWGLVGGLIGDALGKLPLPSVAGLAVGAPSVIGAEGFVVVDVPLAQ